GLGASKLQRALRLSRDDGPRSASTVAVTAEPIGFRVGAAMAGVKTGKRERLDLALVVSDRPCTAAGVFTTNQVIAAPCIVTRRHLERGAIRAIAVNSGIANACTGDQGEKDAIAMAEAAAKVVGCSPYEVAVASTGVIGWPLPVDRIAKAFGEIELRENNWNEAARAMMNTGPKPKSVGVKRGRGAGRVFEVKVSGAVSDADARLAARTITTSNLVKTAIHGADPNWGRILAAAGRSGAKVDQSRATVRIADIAVFERGKPRAFDADAVRLVFSQKDVAIGVDLGVGHGHARAWGTDLSEEYVRINAEYTT